MFGNVYKLLSDINAKHRSGECKITIDGTLDGITFLIPKV